MPDSDDFTRTQNEEPQKSTYPKSTPGLPTSKMPRVDDLHPKTVRAVNPKLLGGIDEMPNENVSQKTRAVSEYPEPSDVSTKPTAYAPVDLAEPGIIIIYKTRKSEAMSVRKGVIEKLIKEQIDKTLFKSGMAGVPYDCDFDFSSRDLKCDFGDIQIINAVICKKLNSLGLTCESNGSAIKISGVPREEFDGNLFFLLVDTAQIKDLLTQLEKTKGRKSFLDFPKEHVHFKAFQINADPRSLWQDLPVTDYEGYQNKDNGHDGCELEIVSPKTKAVSPQSIEVVAASRRGRSHAHAAKPRDDCFYYEIDKQTGWNFVAVADGAGSAKYSRKGSEIACKTVVQKLHEMLNAEYNDFISKETSLFQAAKSAFQISNSKMDESMSRLIGEKTKLDQIFRLAVDTSIRAIYEEVKNKKNAIVKDYHTTLLCCAFKYFNPEEYAKEMAGWFFASYWVGDGGAAILRWNGSENAAVLGEPDGGEFAGQTRFLTIPEEIQEDVIKKRLRYSFCDSFDAMLLLTDGITDPFFPSESAVADEKRWLDFYENKLKNGCDEEPNGCSELFDDSKTPIEKSAALLRWLDFWSKGNHDDRTILVVKPK